MELSLLHPITKWRFRRRLRGGVSDGSTPAEVTEKLGEPTRTRFDEDREIWVYVVGSTRSVVVEYSVCFHGDLVESSWWTEKRLTKDEEV